MVRTIKRKATQVVIGLDSLTGIKALFATEDAFTKARSEHDKEIIATLAKWADSDTFVLTGQAEAGEIYYNLLRMSVETQQAFIGTLAEAQGFPMTFEDKGRWNGRTALAKALYAKHPRLLETKDGQRDSLAAKRISQCILVYKQQAGLATRRPNQNIVGKVTTRALHAAFNVIMHFAQSDAELEVLTKIFERAGLTESILDNWMTELEQAETAVAPAAGAAPQTETTVAAAR
jgi:hypothetical protein